MTMSTYPRQKITITACVLLLLGFALLRLPLDQRAYARESAGMLRMGRRQQEKNQARKGGMVRLSEVKEHLVNHKDTKATKKVLIINGQVPHVTGFTRSVFGPHHEIEEHSHPSMDEVFYVEQGSGIFWVDDTRIQVDPGTCIHIAAGTKHWIKNNHEDEDLVLLYFGIATDQEAAVDGGGGRFETSRAVSSKDQAVAAESKGFPI